MLPHPRQVDNALSLTTSLSLFALRTSNYQQAADLSGMAQFVGYAGAALGPIVFGALHQATSLWTLSLCVLVVVSFLVANFAYLSGRTRAME